MEIEKLTSTLKDSIEMSTQLMIIEEYLRHSEVIRNLNKERRKKSFNLNIWYENMQKSFNKKIEKIMRIEDPELGKEELKKLFKEKDEFNTKFFKRRKELDLLEIEYKQLDRDNKDQLLNYVINLKEELRNKNHEIEQKLMKENLGKKRLD